MKGYAGKYLKVDLTSGTWSSEKLDEKTAKDFIGGYGLGAWTLYNTVPKGADPLGPENVISWWLGPFAGTLVPASSKYVAAAKSPLTGVIGFGICSGGFGAELRSAGWDGVVVTSKSKKPVYIFIDDDHVEIRDAANLWGKDAWETDDLIKVQLGDERIFSSVIGQSGERLVKIANITTDKHRQVGRCGLGAVMGSKNLKGVAVRGTKNVEAADPKTLFELSMKYQQMCQGPATEKYRKHGTPVNVLNLNKLGALPTKNFQYGTFDRAEDVSGERMTRDFVKKVTACHACALGCDHIVITSDESKYAGTPASMDYESLNAFGATCGVSDMNAIIQAVNYCDRFGVDTISGGVIVSWAMECFERGLLPGEYTDGLDLKFGNSDAMVEATRKMCLREGRLGNLLAEGTRRASEIMGNNTIRYAIQIKGLEYGMYGMRAMQTSTLGFATCVTGAFYQRSGSYQYDAGGKVDRYKLEPSRGKLVADGEYDYAIVDSLIQCKFTRGVIATMDEKAKLFTAITGIPMTGAEMLKSGQRIHNLAKCFNIREGAGRKDDYPPWRALNEALYDNVNKGAIIDLSQYEAALDAYYAYCGWSSQGIPLKRTLLALGLDKAAQEVGV